METRFLRIFRSFKNRFLLEKQAESKINKGLPPVVVSSTNTTDILLQESWSVIRNRLFHGISFLFIGFLLGNLFGTFLSLIRIVLPWDGFIVIIILFFMELISYSRYHRQKLRFLGIWKSTMILKERDDARIVDNTKDDVVWNWVVFSSITRMGPAWVKSLVELRPSSKQNPTPGFVGNQQTTRSPFVPYFFNRSRACNSFKIGFLLGFFIDAYKVGS